MQMVHKIFHAMEKDEECWLYWSIRVSNQLHGDILKFIVYLNRNMHDTYCPLVEWYSMGLFKFFQFFSNEWCIYIKILFNLCICLDNVIYETWCPILSLFPDIIDFFHDMVCLINTGATVTLYNGYLQDKEEYE